VKYVDEFRDPRLAKALIQAIARVSFKPVRFMELCGTHTMTIARYGLIHMLPETIEMVSGPGCPVCVTTIEEIDRMVKLARIPGVIVATFGDLVRVPGSHSSLLRERATGAQVKIVYSALDALDLALAHPDRQVVFIGIGFETTAPTVAAAVIMAKQKNVLNFSILNTHKLFPPALVALLSDSNHGINGFLCPGHVTTIIGTGPYEDIAKLYGASYVVSGFEPVDILGAILMLVNQVEERRTEVEIQYGRGVCPQGNSKARVLMEKVFVLQDSNWRGLGLISLSGLGFASPFISFDARTRFDLEVPLTKEHPNCRCGDVLRGLIRSPECKLFSQVCTPENPLGPCMVSMEGSCTVWYKYRRN